MGDVQIGTATGAHGIRERPLQHAIRCALALAVLLLAGCGGTTSSKATGENATSPTRTSEEAGGKLIWGGAYGSKLGISSLAGRPSTSIVASPSMNPNGIAAQGSYLYLSQNTVPATITRASLQSGAQPGVVNVQTGFITLPNTSTPPDGVAADENHVYWTTGSAIGRANLDGSGVEDEFIANISVSRGGNIAAQAAQGIAVGGEYIYWAGGGAIGRARLDGSEVNPELISGLDQSNPAYVALDAEHLYWSSGGSIGRARLDGSAVEPSFLTAHQPYGIAVDDAHIYWGGYGAPIGRATIAGTQAEPGWLNTQGVAGGVQALAVASG